MVPLVGTPVVGGDLTGRAASPDAEYSQTSPVSPAIPLALGTGEGARELAGTSGTGGGLGI